MDDDTITFFLPLIVISLLYFIFLAYVYGKDREDK